MDVENPVPRILCEYWLRQAASRPASSRGAGSANAGKEPKNPDWLGNGSLIYEDAGTDTVPADASVDSGVF